MDFADGGIPKLSVIDGHESDGHRHPASDGNLDLIGRPIRNAFSMFKHAPDHHPEEFIDIPGLTRPAAQEPGGKHATQKDVRQNLRPAPPRF